MTDDELQAMWVSDAKLSDIVQATGRNPMNLTSHIRRLRDREGEQRWPKRRGAITLNPAKRPPVPRAGASTLPPLASLSDA